MRRAGLPFAVTQGFSPHMRIAFSAALPVATASDAEWYDLVLTEYVPAPEVLARLAAATPADLHPEQAGYVDLRADTLGILITRQDYRIALALVGGIDADSALDGARRALTELDAAGSIPYLRGRKEKVLDLGALLVDAGISRAGADALALTLRTRTSNAGSLRPEILIAALDARFGAGDPEAPIVSTGIPRLANFSASRSAAPPSTA